LSAPKLVEHFFRHEYGRLVATLARRVGMRHVEMVEDAVQSSLETALQAWTVSGLPDNPSAWLYRVARNKLAGQLRQSVRRQRLAEQHALDQELPADPGAAALLSGQVRDDLLRMLFACCHDDIPADSQLVFALKSLCGFDVREIALRLFTSEANVYKRLARARERLRTLPRDALQSEFLDASTRDARLPAVHRILYLMFTEGYLSSRADAAIRRELCEDAIRLTTILADHALGRTPATCALLALMHLHAARFDARLDGMGGLLLLEEQDRERWDQQRIALGLSWLAQSSEGERISRYHAEAAIAAEHCLAPTLAETRWQRVAKCYELLHALAPSPLHELNRAVAVSEWQGPAAALAIVESLQPPTWLEGSYLWAAVLADLHHRCGNAQAARLHRANALESAPTPAVKRLLERRWCALENRAPDA
jgi:RNA polymerase sigma-70 factor (ECF subfamily)